MHTKLPKIIDALIKANNEHNSDAYIACFTDNAVVQDEGKDIQGTNAIKEWNEWSSKEYHANLEALRLVNKNEDMVLTATVSGNFEGSPVNLDYHFTISNDKIAALKILLTEE
jgi:hypothetical protein